MVNITSAFVLSALALVTSAVPLERRIAQNTPDSKAPWEAACDAAGGGADCNKIAVTAAGTLLAAAGPCEQQDSADAMIDLAKKLNNDSEMIRLAQIFVQQPRNAPDSLQVPYCQVAPKNAELDGLFHCQFAGSKFPTFSGDQSGNIPLGLSAPLNPAGSCPAKPDGPVPDGEQLNTLVHDPGVGGPGANSAGSAAGADGVAGVASGAIAGGADGSANGDDGVAGATAADAGGVAGASSASSASSVTASAGARNGAVGGSAGSSSYTPSVRASSDFKKQNGLDAQLLNQKFANWTANSSCTDGANGCIGDAFAQCVGGKFITTPCGSGLTCAALPLVNSKGTSVTCTTAADRDARIATALSS